MRLAEVVQPKNGELEIPLAFLRTLGIHSESGVYIRLLDYKIDTAPQQLVITTVPVHSWPTVRRLSVHLEHRPGALHDVAQGLQEIGVNILVMEGYGVHPGKEGWWSALVDLAGCKSESPSRDEFVMDKLCSLFGKDGSRLAKAAPHSGLRKIEIISNQSNGAFERQPNAEPLASLESIAINFLFKNAVRSLGSNEEPRFVKRGKLDVKDFWEGSGSRKGLLLSSPEERLMSLTEIPTPVEIMLVIKVWSDPDKLAGVGTLADLTGTLKDWDTGGVERGINIVFTYNYVTDRRREVKGTKEVVVESSIVKFYLETPSAWRPLLDRKKVAKWIEVFERLVQYKPVDTQTAVAPVDALQSRMRIWSDRERLFRGKANRQATEVGLIGRLLASRSFNQRLQFISFGLTGLLVLCALMVPKLNSVCYLLAGGPAALWITSVVYNLARGFGSE